jgi:hypothetical protein
MKKGSHNFQMMKHQQKMQKKELRESQDGITYWDKLYEAQKKRQRKLYNKVAYSVPIWRHFEQGLKDDIISSFKASKDRAKELKRKNGNNTFFMSTGNIFEIDFNMSFADFIDHLFDYELTKDEDEPYGISNIVKRVQEYKAQYRDIKIDMYLK